MAELSVEGLDGLILSMEELARIPDEVRDAILLAQGQVVAQAQREAAQAFADTGQTARSVWVKEPKEWDGRRTVTISFRGSRKRGNKRVRNGEIAYLNEYGAPSLEIPGRQWIRTANEKCAQAAIQAGAQVYEEFLRRNGL